MGNGVILGKRSSTKDVGGSSKAAAHPGIQEPGRLLWILHVFPPSPAAGEGFIFVFPLVPARTPALPCWKRVRRGAARLGVAFGFCCVLPSPFPMGAVRWKGGEIPECGAHFWE